MVLKSDEPNLAEAYRPPLAGTYGHNMLEDWIGVEGWIKKVSLQYRGMNLKNDWVVCKGTVTGKYEEGGEHLVELDVCTENGKGRSPRRGRRWCGCRVAGPRMPPAVSVGVAVKDGAVAVANWPA